MFAGKRMARDRARSEVSRAARRAKRVRIDVVAIELDEGGASVRHYRNAVSA